MKRIVLHSISVMILMTILVLTTAQANPRSPAQANPQPHRPPNVGSIFYKVRLVLGTWKPAENSEPLKVSANVNASLDYSGNGKIDAFDIRKLLEPLQNISPHYPRLLDIRVIRGGVYSHVLNGLNHILTSSPEGGIPGWHDWERKWLGKIKDILLPRSDVDKDEDTDFEDIVSVANILALHRESPTPYRTFLAPGGRLRSIAYVWANLVSGPSDNGLEVISINDLVAVAKDPKMMPWNLEAATTALSEKGKVVWPTDIDNWLKTPAVKGSTKAKQALALLKRAFANVNSDHIVDYADLVEVGNAVFAEGTIPITTQNVNRDKNVDGIDIVDGADIVFVTTYIDAQTNVAPILASSVSFRYRDISKWTLEATENNKTTAAARLTSLMAHLLPQWANVNGDATVDFSDLIFVGDVYSKIASDASVTTTARATADADKDKAVDIHDIILVAQETAGNPETAVTKAMLVDRIEMFTQAEVDKWIKQVDSVDPTSIYYPDTVKSKAKSVLERLKAALPVRSADVNGDKQISVVDLILVANAVKGTVRDGDRPNTNGDLFVTDADVLFVAENFPNQDPATISSDIWNTVPNIKPVFTHADVKLWISQASGKARVIEVLGYLSWARTVALMDVDNDGEVDFTDLILVGNAVKRSKSEPDINGDGSVNVYDIYNGAASISTANRTAVAATEAVRAVTLHFDRTDIDSWIESAQELEFTDVVAVLELLKAPLLSADVDGSGQIDFHDIKAVGNYLKTPRGSLSFQGRTDVNGDRIVDFKDLFRVAQVIDEGLSANNVYDGLNLYAAAAAALFTSSDMQGWIRLALAEYGEQDSMDVLRKFDFALRSPPADVNTNFSIDFYDLGEVGNYIKQPTTYPKGRTDVNENETVDVQDLLLVAEAIHKTAQAKVIEAAITMGTPASRATPATSQPNNKKNPVTVSIYESTQLNLHEAAARVAFTAADMQGWIRTATQQYSDNTDAIAVLRVFAEALQKREVELKKQAADFNNDKTLDFKDIIAIGEALVSTPTGDVNGDGELDVDDMAVVVTTIHEAPDLDAGRLLSAAGLKTAIAGQIEAFAFHEWDVNAWIKEATDGGHTTLVTALNVIKASPALTSPDVVDDDTLDFKDIIAIGNAIVHGKKGTNLREDVTRNDRLDVGDMAVVVGAIITYASDPDTVRETVLGNTALANIVARQTTPFAFHEWDVNAWIKEATDEGHTTLVTALNVIKASPKLSSPDVVDDGTLDFQDVIAVGNAIHQDSSGGNLSADVKSANDVKRDNLLNIYDMAEVVNAILKHAADPGTVRTTIFGEAAIRTAVGGTPPEFSRAKVDAWIKDANKGGYTVLVNALGILKNQVPVNQGGPQAPALTLALPKETGLLTNYPNPFNPETWIPYHLAAPAKVSIAIYAADGRLVRTLDLGHLPAGRYHEKSSAAYWDGRNAQGEPVASGLYFYTFTAGEFTATKKMLIMK